MYGYLSEKTIKYMKSVYILWNITFDRYMQRYINFRFWICTDNLFMIARFSVNLQSFYEMFDTEIFSQNV